MIFHSFFHGLALASKDGRRITVLFIVRHRTTNVNFLMGDVKVF